MPSPGLPCCEQNQVFFVFILSHNWLEFPESQESTWGTQMAAFIVLWDLANLLEASVIPEVVWSHWRGARGVRDSLVWFLLRSAPDAISVWTQSILKLCSDQGTKIYFQKVICINFQTNCGLPIGATWPPKDKKSKRQENWNGMWAQKKQTSAQGWESSFQRLILQSGKWRCQICNLLCHWDELQWVKSLSWVGKLSSSVCLPAPFGYDSFWESSWQILPGLCWGNRRDWGGSELKELTYETLSA